MDSIQGPHNPYDGLSVSVDMREARLSLGRFGSVPELRAGLHQPRCPSITSPLQDVLSPPPPSGLPCGPISLRVREAHPEAPQVETSIAQAGPAEAPQWSPGGPGPSFQSTSQPQVCSPGTRPTSLSRRGALPGTHLAPLLPVS